MKCRIGKFNLSKFIVERDQQTAMAIMGRCVVVRCEHMFYRGTFEYLAISPEFDEIYHDEMPPRYDVIISDSGNSIRFVRTTTEPSVREQPSNACDMCGSWTSDIKDGLCPECKNKWHESKKE